MSVFNLAKDIPFPQTTALTSDKEPSIHVWAWFLGLCAISIFNILAFILLICTYADQTGYAKRYTRGTFFHREYQLYSYQKTQLMLAFWFVLQCAQRSFWPEIYNIRVVYWDTFIGSPFVGRGLATIGEVTWTSQLAFCLIWCEQELNFIIQKYRKNQGWVSQPCGWLNSIAYLSIFLCFSAEFFCNYAMFTLNYFGNVVETCLWSSALGLLLPYCIILYMKCGIIEDVKEVSTTHIRWFLIGAALTCFAFVVQLSVDHIPLQYRLWQEDVKKGQVYMSLIDGVYSSMHHRIKSHSWEDWKDDWFWMAAYFSGGVWICLLMASAPRLHLNRNSGGIKNE